MTWKAMQMALVPACLTLVACGDSGAKDGAASPAEEAPTTFHPGISYGTMTDQDGNTYKTVVIGTQTWMAENLRATSYYDGGPIAEVTDSHQWNLRTTGAYCSYENTTDPGKIARYGRLYNWFAVSTGKLAPKGWHVPTDAEWTTMITFLGGESVAGGKMKETGTAHWNDPNAAATNESGFTALPAGFRHHGMDFQNARLSTYFWSSTEEPPDNAILRDLWADHGTCSRGANRTKNGYSVRCVKD